MSVEDILALVRNNNLDDEELIKLAYILLNEVCNKKETPSSCYLCGGGGEYMGVECSVCQ